MTLLQTQLQLGVWTDATKALEEQLADEHKLSIKARNLLKSDLAFCQSRARFYERELELKLVRDYEIPKLKEEMAT